MAEQPTEKTCTKCGEIKPLDAYYRNKSRPDGRADHCKVCRLAEASRYRQENAEKLREADRKYRRENAAAIKARRQEGAEERRERDRQHYRENAEQIRARDREYRRENVERVRERERQYYRDNLHIHWAVNYRRRAVRNGQEPREERFTRADVIAKYGDHCAYCEAGEFEELDHYIPVKAGGPHTLENARPACSACNRAKWDADPEEWLAEQDEFDALTEDEQNALIDAEIAKYLNEED